MSVYQSKQCVVLFWIKVVYIYLFTAGSWGKSAAATNAGSATRDLTAARTNPIGVYRSKNNAFQPEGYLQTMDEVSMLLLHFQIQL